MERQVRYCTTDDGVRIAYCMEGTGPALIVCPFFFESFAFDSVVPEFHSFVEEVGEGRTLIRFDQRGTGLSQPVPEDLTVAAQARDLAAVVHSADMGPVSILAGTLAGPRAIKFAADEPEAVRSLILYGTFARPLDVMPWESIQALGMLARANWMVASQTFADMAGREAFPETLMRFADFYRQSVTGEVVAATLEASYQTDVSELLPRITAPTLVLHRQHDSIFPFKNGQTMAASISGARFVPAPGVGHNIALGESEPIFRAITSFLAETGAGPADAPAAVAPETSIIKTVLFTDLAGHTEMMSRLGDSRGRDVLREHERATRAVLATHGGAEVKTLGDGFMASFGSVSRAVECAMALQRAMAEWNEGEGARHGALLSVRVGINAGEPIEEDGDLFGASVILASRIAAKAAGGEIMVADTVRGLCSGKGFLFSDRGEFVAKGFEEPVRLFEVRWQE